MKEGWFDRGKLAIGKLKVKKEKKKEVDDGLKKKTNKKKPCSPKLMVITWHKDGPRLWS